MPHAMPRITHSLGALFLLAAPVALPAQSLRDTDHVRSLSSTLEYANSLASLATRRLGAVFGQLGQLNSLSELRSLSSLGSLTQLADLGALADADMGNLSAFSTTRHRDLLRHTPAGGDEQQADSLYRRAREALSGGEYRRAATLFEQIYARYPKTRYASDALYFRAFSLYRTGDTGDMRTALGSLQTLTSKYDGATVQGDARTLRVRICGELAKRGDERCTTEVEGISASASGSSIASAGSARAATSTARAAQSAQCPDEDDEDDERIAALNALLQMDSERALPILEKVLARRDACSAGLRRKAVFLVSQKGNARAAEILLNAAKTDPDKEVRGQALFWLGQTNDDRAVDMLEEVLRNTADGELQDKAIFGLAQHRSERAQQILRNAALNTSLNHERREQAIFWLGQKKGGANSAFLRELYEKINDRQLKEKVIFSASQQRSEETKSWLLGIVTNEREAIDLRKNALFWASQHRAVSMAELGTMYDQLSDREMKEQVIFAISQRRDSAATGRMLDIARTEKDRELRKKAIFWLSQSKDPRVAKFLEELISK